MTNRTIPDGQVLIGVDRQEATSSAGYAWDFPVNRSRNGISPQSSVDSKYWLSVAGGLWECPGMMGGLAEVAATTTRRRSIDQTKRTSWSCCPCRCKFDQLRAFGVISRSSCPGFHGGSGGDLRKRSGIHSSAATSISSNSTAFVWIDVALRRDQGFFRMTVPAFSIRMMAELLNRIQNV